jgi:hypothetical protein
MNWQQKYEQIRALRKTELDMLRPGEWRVYQQGVKLVRGGTMHWIDSGTGGISPKPAATPQAAVEAYWRLLTSGVVVLMASPMYPRVEQVRWTGTEWETIE